MQEKSVQKLNIEGVLELWLRPRGEAGEHALVYRPAMLVECSVNFRSLRAGLNHSEERSYTAWVPEREMAIDWDKPAAEISRGSQLAVLSKLRRPFLHAARLGFSHPRTGARMTFDAPLPDDLAAILEPLRRTGAPK